ncbi:MAG: hypothetical protein M3O61_02550 [Gemmatimonadota bacterium]|nr:hypothetical protein [Gemmatimonadota bacterium]
MRILLVGALSWNPERVRSLCERGHRLWGLWSRSMSWDQGPYLATSGCIQQVALEDAVSIVREQKIECVYSLFQVYHPRLWGATSPGIEHDVWTALRTLVTARDRGELDVPIVRHWGFDIHNMDLDVARAFDGQIFCNRQKLDYWTTPLGQGGCGIHLVEDGDIVDFLDSDRQKLEFMNDDFPEKLSAATGEIHTVCIGRPFGIDYLAAARRGIHVHMYGNRFDDIYRTMARDLSLAGARREVRLLSRFLHIHPSIQTHDGPWEDVRRAKSRWVREFAQYDAGWSYIGSPLPWEPLDDRGAIPNRLSTCLLAGLPVISDTRPGYYRYDELARLGVNIDLDGDDYDGLRDRLAAEARTGERRANAIRERSGYSFDSTIDPLIAFLARATERYFTRPLTERTRFTGGRSRLIHFNTSPERRAHAMRLLRRLLRPPDSPGAPADGRFMTVAHALGDQVNRRTVGFKAKVLARQLRHMHERAPAADAPANGQ